MVTYNFTADLARGQQGEQWLVAAYPTAFEQLDGRNGDIRIRASGNVLELKTESRSLASTPNFFFERIGDTSRDTNGGPWQAKDKGCTYYAFLFVPDRRVFVFKVGELVERLEKYIVAANPKAYSFVSDNCGSRYESIGFKCPREYLADLVYSETTLPPYEELLGGNNADIRQEGRSN